MTLLSFATSVDYNSLVQQKLTLLNLVENQQISPEQRDDIDGLINFIDAYQDAIVESHIKMEEEVFPI
jgi:hypothetical protein